ncbi:PhoH family protein [Agaricicola taiwanensis]|uniref:PhoH family protein n=1 Tax=Agaricicola taiwanensis TaxID=591372 RepID=UPI001E299A0D|nr:PhoH family protein [Agaricicola taiwanensis]
MADSNGDQGGEIVLTFDDNRIASALYGSHDQNLAFLERRLGISATPRGNLLAIRGPREACEQASSVLRKLHDRIRKGGNVALGDVDGAIRLTAAQGSLFPTAPTAAEPAGIFAQLSTRKKSVSARTPAQDAYIRAFGRHELVFGVGPAGTGKTYLAVVHAAQLLERGEVDRIILSRPAVEAGERLGFLPGDMREKVDPYLRPLYDALHDVMPPERVERGLQNGIIEVAPLAFMRGRTLAHAAVILDEAQNATSMQMKMFLTRLGEGSRMVVTGDPSQVDLPNGMTSGLAEAVRLLDGVEGVSICRFTDVDVVRHELVARIVRAYEAAPRADVRE